MKDEKKLAGPIEAVVYIVIIGVVCTLLGVVAGICIGKKCVVMQQPCPKMGMAYMPEKAGMHYPGKKWKAETGHFRKKMKAKAVSLFEKIRHELDLSEDQDSKVDTILNDAKQQFGQARADFTAALKKIRLETDTQITQLLNPQQKEKFEELKANMKKCKYQKFGQKEKVSSDIAQ